jgi:AraC-like DNA-binding protein
MMLTLVTQCRKCKNYLANLDRSQVAMQIKSKLIDALPSGPVTEQDMAKALNMSLRSLQRKLKEEDTSFKKILEETRKELSAQYIKNSRLSLGEITFLLGFSEPANFSRAFKRWTGVAPSDYSASL